MKWIIVGTYYICVYFAHFVESNTTVHRQPSPSVFWSLARVRMSGNDRPSKHATINESSRNDLRSDCCLHKQRPICSKTHRLGHKQSGIDTIGWFGANCIGKCLKNCIRAHRRQHSNVYYFSLFRLVSHFSPFSITSRARLYPWRCSWIHVVDVTQCSRLKPWPWDKQTNVLWLVPSTI